MVIAEWNGGALPTISGSSITSGTGTGLLNEHLLVQHDGTAATYAEWSFTATSTIALRYYIELPSAWASSSHALTSFRYNANNSLRASLGGTSAAGSMRLIDNAGTQLAASGTHVVDVSMLYRIEAQVNHAANQGRIGVWTAGGTLLYDSGWTTGVFLAQANTVRIGATTGASPQLGAMKIAT